jgi:hypothetical protein
LALLVCGKARASGLRGPLFVVGCLKSRVVRRYFGSISSKGRLALRIDEKLGGEGRHREQAVPPMTRASGVPTQLATMPNNRLPNDSMPRRAMTNTKDPAALGHRRCTMVCSMSSDIILKKTPTSGAQAE